MLNLTVDSKIDFSCRGLDARYNAYTETLKDILSNLFDIKCSYSCEMDILISSILFKKVLATIFKDGVHTGLHKLLIIDNIVDLNEEDNTVDFLFTFFMKTSLFTNDVLRQGAYADCFLLTSEDAMYNWLLKNKFKSLSDIKDISLLEKGVTSLYG